MVPRGQLSRGTPWWEFDGANPAEAWAAAEAASRVSVHEELLQQELASSNSGMVYRSVQGNEKAS
jgi:hypothetical protein